MGATQIFYAYVGSIGVALLMLMASWRWPTVGRLFFVLLFAWAGEYNLRTAMVAPWAYVDFAPLATSELYRQFILGAFARHVTPIVGAIALGQLAIAALVAYRASAVRLGLAGAVVFLVAIAPLGIGSAFPATLIMAAAALVLMRRTRDAQALWEPFVTHPVRRAATVGR